MEQYHRLISVNHYSTRAPFSGPEGLAACDWGGEVGRGEGVVSFAGQMDIIYINIRCPAYAVRHNCSYVSHDHQRSVIIVVQRNNAHVISERKVDAKHLLSFQWLKMSWYSCFFACNDLHYEMILLCFLCLCCGTRTEQGSLRTSPHKREYGKITYSS